MCIYGLFVKICITGPTYVGPTILFHEEKFSGEDLLGLVNEAIVAGAQRIQQVVSYLVEKYGFVAPEFTATAVAEWSS